MPDAGTLGFQEAGMIVGELAQACAERHGALPAAIVLVGGTALAAHAVRDHSHAIDVYLDRLDDDAVAALTAQYACRYGPSFTINATPSETIGGDIAIRDIAKSPLVVKATSSYGEIAIRALTVETLYLFKAAADRDKDRADLISLAKHTCYADVLTRAKTLFPWYGDRQRLPDYVERLGRRLAEHFSVSFARVDRDFDLPKSIATKVQEIRLGMEEQYWPAVKELMRASPEHLVVDPKMPKRVTFDAKAAGAPDIVQQALRNQPHRAAVLAAEMLRTIDPARSKRGV